MQSSEPTESTSPATVSVSKPSPVSLLISIIALVIAIIAIFLAIFTFVQGLKIHGVALTTEHLNQNIINTRLQTTEELQHLKSRLSKQQLALTDTQNSLSRLLRIASNTELQRTLGEVSYLLHMANLHLTIAHDTETAVKLLQTAQNRLNIETNPSLFNLKYAIANDIAALKAAPSIDTSNLIIRLDNLNQAIKQIPIIPSAPTATVPSKIDQEKLVALPWYKRMWHQLGGLKDLVVIRHLQKPTTPLLSPQEINFLRENIELKLSQAQWAVMYQMPKIYQKNLELVKKWINTYYQNQDPNIIQKINEQIDELLKINIKPSLPTLDNALQALQEIEKVSTQPTIPTVTPQEPTKLPQTPTPTPQIKPKQPNNTTQGVEV